MQPTKLQLKEDGKNAPFKSPYGLKACFILAQNYPARCVSASHLEKEIAVSGKYIEKIMRMLSYIYTGARRNLTG